MKVQQHQWFLEFSRWQEWLWSFSLFFNVKKISPKILVRWGTGTACPGMLECPIQEVFIARLDGALGNLISWVASLSMVGGLELNDLKGSSQPKIFYVSMIRWKNVVSSIDSSSSLLVTPNSQYTSLICWFPALHFSCLQTGSQHCLWLASIDLSFPLTLFHHHR